MTDKKSERVRKAIIILAILLALSILALGGVLIYRYLTDSTSTIVQVPDNLITDSSSVSDGSNEDSSDSIKHKFTICLLPQLRRLLSFLP